jgi:hypothetical protein
MLQPSALRLPAPDYKNRLVFGYGYNEDIISTLNKQFPKAVEQCGAVKFSGSNFTEKGRAIYNYLRNSVKYKKDPEGRQMIQLPARLLGGQRPGEFPSADCKSLSLAAAAFMHCAGFPNVRLRYTSYKKNNHTPTHVYAVGSDEKGQDIIIDAVYKQFNKEVPYTYKKDYPMEISILSGTPAPMRQVSVKTNMLKKRRTIQERLETLRGKVRPGGFLFTVITNELARQQGGPFVAAAYTSEQLSAYKAKVRQAAEKTQQPFIKKVLQAEAAALDGGKFQGALYAQRSGQAIKGLEEEIGKLSLKKLRKGLKKISIKNIVKGAKAVGLVAPRKAFLLLVTLNVRGLAKRMSKLSDADLKKLWEDRFAGKLSVLKGAIKRGLRKNPLFGASKKVRSIKGVGAVIDETIGAEPASTVSLTTIIAAASPILIAVIALLKKKGVPTVPENAAAPGETGDFADAQADAAAGKPKLEQWIEKAVDVAQATGIIPEKPQSLEEAKVSQAVPGDDLEADPAEGRPAGPRFALSPVILVGGAAAAYFLLNRKK